MRSLGYFILAGPFQAVSVVSGFALLSFFFPFLVILSGGALALIALKIGIREALRVLVICVAIVGGISFFLLGGVTAGTLVVWVSVVAVVYLYRHFQSLSIAMQALTVFGAVVTILAALLYPDMQATWLRNLKGLLAVIEQGPSFQIMLQNSALDFDRVRQNLPKVASLMTGMVVAIYLLTVSITLFFAGWWQGLLDDVRTFHKEFVRLDLGLALAAFTVALGAAAWVIKTAIFWQLMIVCLSMFFLQGLGLAHAMIGQLPKPMFGFVAVYGLMLIAAPQVILTLASVGVLDGFVNFRKRFVKSKM